MRFLCFMSGSMPGYYYKNGSISVKLLLDIWMVFYVFDGCPILLKWKKERTDAFSFREFDSTSGQG